MKKLSDEIISFFQKQGCVIVSTLDDAGSLHNSCKGIVEIDNDGHIYLFDLYVAKTRDNLQKNPNMSITAIDEHHFIGYCLKGKARIVTESEMLPRLIKAWEDRIASRLTGRLLRNIHGDKGHPLHPEALLPKPEYLISMEVEEIVDLTPHPMK